MPGAVVVRIQVDFSVNRRPEVASCCRLPDSQLRACAVTLRPAAHLAGVGQRLHGSPLPAAGPAVQRQRGGWSGRQRDGLRTLQAPACLLVGVCRTAREATRQAGVRHRRAPRRGAGQAFRPQAGELVPWTPWLAREGGGARRGGRMPGYSGLPRRLGLRSGLGRKLLGGPRLRPHYLAAELGHPRVPLLFARLRVVV